MKKALIVTIAAAMAAAMAGVADGATSVSITSPRNGANIFLRRTPSLSVAGTAAFAPATASSTKFYLRRDGCGTSNDNPHLSVTSGTDQGDGCGLVVSSVAGPGGTVDQGAFVDYPSQDGTPLAFDASRAITGVIDIENFSAAAAGQVTVDVSMEAAVVQNGQLAGIPMGSDSESVLVSPAAADYPVPFTITPNPQLNGADLSGIDLRVRVEGPFVFSGFIGNSGKSWVGVPSYAGSVHRSVQVSVDDPTFSQPAAATLNGSLTGWTAAIPTPAVGRHTIYARSVQGFDTSPVASISITVK